MPKRIRWVADAREAARSACLSVVAIAVAALAMAADAPQVTMVALGVVMLVVAIGMILHVRYAIRQLHGQSKSALRAAAEAEAHHVQVLRRIVRFVEARDKYWRGHSENVGRLAERIGRRMGLEAPQCERLRLAGELHDIGMIAVPEHVFKNSRSFSVNDYRSVKAHSRVSYEVLRPLELLRDVLPAVKHHHERMNGTGYPTGLSGQRIPLEARILAVADAYEAMIHDRPHRPAMTPLQAMNELARCSPAGYDPDCVLALADVVNLPDLVKMAGGAEPVGGPRQEVEQPAAQDG